MRRGVSAVRTLALLLVALVFGVPLAELRDRAPLELAADQPVYVICNSGNRSQTGAQILVDLGYLAVYNVAGGIRAWLAAGLPVESYPLALPFRAGAF
jgi:rhodanese-related sulfurtransferase